MKDIKQRIKERFYLGNPPDVVADQIIEEIVKPIAKEAFEAGERASFLDAYGNFYPDKDQWISEKFTSNKQ